MSLCELSEPSDVSRLVACCGRTDGLILESKIVRVCRDQTLAQSPPRHPFFARPALLAAAFYRTNSVPRPRLPRRRLRFGTIIVAQYAKQFSGSAALGISVHHEGSDCDHDRIAFGHLCAPKIRFCNIGDEGHRVLGVTLAPRRSIARWNGASLFREQWVLDSLHRRHMRLKSGASALHRIRSCGPGTPGGSSQ